MPESLKEIINRLERQQSAVERALSALREAEGTSEQRSPSSSSTQSRTPAKKKGGMTPEGRRRLAEAMKRRWAAKRAASQVSKKAGARRGPRKKGATA